MKVLTAAEMGAVDKATAEAGVPLQDLMEHAGSTVASFCLRQYPEAARVMVLCGKGNNGGDGFVAARVLAGEGVGVRVLLAGSRDGIKGEAAEALKRLVEATDEGVLEELDDEVPVEELAELLGEADLLVDAVFGTGFKGPMRAGVAANLRDAVAQVEVPVMAVDLPSGWDADSYEETVEGCYRADAVVTFTAPKIAHVFGHLTADVFGPVVVGEIGSPDELIESGLRLTWTGVSKRLTEKKRPINSNKGKFGHVLVVGGSYGTAGAPSMASLACLRSGAGLVTAAVPTCVMDTVARIAPELMMRGLSQDEKGSAAVANLDGDALKDLLKGIKVVALGPGLSTKGEASEFARELVAKTADVEGKALPIVIDADGLNAFDSEKAKALDGSGRTMVITPHPGEMARLLGVTVPEVEADRVGIARKFATEHHLTLVLKGWRTLVAHPDGRVAVNTTGNPALAKGGSGDLLTGILAAMLAQHPEDVAAAVEAAVYLHGLAADLVAQKMDEKSVLATDVIAGLSEAFGYRTRDEDGLEWIAGIRARED
jgi:NAD(P)H-hydrate epimerase